MTRGGVVETVAARIGSDGLVDVVVAVEPGELPPLPGLLVRGEIQIGTTQEATLVPLEAVLRQGDEQYVVLQDAQGTAHKAEVKVLAASRTQAAIAGELLAGARVVKSGGFNVHDGARLVEEASPNEGKK